MIVSGNPQNDVLGEAARNACAAISDPVLQEALSQAVAEIIVGRQLGRLDRIERASAA